MPEAVVPIVVEPLPNTTLLGWPIDPQEKLIWTKLLGVAGIKRVIVTTCVLCKINHCFSV